MELKDYYKKASQQQQQISIKNQNQLFVCTYQKRKDILTFLLINSRQPNFYFTKSMTQTNYQQSSNQLSMLFQTPEELFQEIKRAMAQAPHSFQIKDNSIHLLIKISNKIVWKTINLQKEKSSMLQNFLINQNKLLQAEIQKNKKLQGGKIQTKYNADILNQALQQKNSYIQKLQSKLKATQSENIKLKQQQAKSSNQKYQNMLLQLNMQKQKSSKYYKLLEQTVKKQEIKLKETTGYLQNMKNKLKKIASQENKDIRGKQIIINIPNKQPEVKKVPNKKRNVIFTKISEIEPGDQNVNVVGKILSLEVLGKGKMSKLQIGDQTGIIDAFLPTEGLLAEGKILEFLHINVDVFKEHIQIVKTRRSLIKASNIQIAKVNLQLDISQKQWIPAQ